MIELMRNLTLAFSDLHIAAIEVLVAGKKLPGRTKLSKALEKLHNAARNAEPLIGFASPIDDYHDETDQLADRRREGLKNATDEFFFWREQVERERAADRCALKGLAPNALLVAVRCAHLGVAADQACDLRAGGSGGEVVMAERAHFLAEEVAPSRSSVVGLVLQRERNEPLNDSVAAKNQTRIDCRVAIIEGGFCQDSSPESADRSVHTSGGRS